MSVQKLRCDPIAFFRPQPVFSTISLYFVRGLKSAACIFTGEVTCRSYANLPHHFLTVHWYFTFPYNFRVVGLLNRSDILYLLQARLCPCVKSLDGFSVLIFLCDHKSENDHGRDTAHSRAASALDVTTRVIKGAGAEVHNTRCLHLEWFYLVRESYYTIT